MASSTESEEAKAARLKEWKRNSWSSKRVTQIIASSTEMIKIKGTASENFDMIFEASVHKELLCYFSPYYTAALKGGFLEAKKDTITIELEFDLMQDLVSWLYSGNLGHCSVLRLPDLYLFADEKMMLALRRSIMTKFVYYQEVGYRDLDDEATLQYVQQLPSTSGLFRYIVDYWVVLWSQGHFECEVEEMGSSNRIPRTFFYQALRRFSTVANSRSLRKPGEENLLTDSL